MAPVYRHRGLIIITADIRDAANVDARAFDPEGGESTFSAPLSPTGEEPATHYACSVACTDEQREMIEQMRAVKYPLKVFIWFYDLDAEPEAPQKVFEGMGLLPVAPREV
jgi:hypothetical protein